MMQECWLVPTSGRFRSVAFVIAFLALAAMLVLGAVAGLR